MENWNVLAMCRDYYRIAFKPYVQQQRCRSQLHLANSTVLVPGSTKMNETEIKMQTLWQMNLRDVTRVNWRFSIACVSVAILSCGSKLSLWPIHSKQHMYKSDQTLIGINFVGKQCTRKAYSKHTENIQHIQTLNAASIWNRKCTVNPWSRVCGLIHSASSNFLLKLRIMHYLTSAM